MIIICENCNKKFNLDEKLIPDNGRLLKCSSCDYEWHFILKEDPFLLKDEEQISNKEDKISKNEKKDLSFKNQIDTYDENEKLKSETKSTNVINTKKNNSHFFSYLLVLIITITAVIIILDTFKLAISIYVPAIIPILDNLYQSLNDIFLFSKNLFF